MGFDFVNSLTIGDFGRDKKIQFGRPRYEITVMENVMMITMMTAVMMMNAVQEQSQETKPLTRRSHLLFCSNLSMSREGCTRHPVVITEAWPPPLPPADDTCDQV